MKGVCCRAAESVGALLLQEKEHWLPLPAENFDLAEISFPRVNQAGCAKVRTNFYSVPLKPGTVVEARVLSSVVEFRRDGGGSRSMSAAMAAPSRCWSWNIISTCWSRSPARYQDRNPWRSGGRKADGQPATTSSGSA